MEQIGLEEEIECYLRSTVSLILYQSFNLYIDLVSFS